MKRRKCLSLIGGLGAACLSSPGLSLAQGSHGPAPGDRLALPSLTRIDGNTLPASHWQGKVVVIELWATWCPFCAKQNPHLDALHRRFVDKGLEVIALSIDKDVEAVRRYMQEKRYAFHAAMFDDRWRQAIGRPRGLPIVWVIDRASKLVRLDVGELFPEDIEEIGKLV